MFEFGAPEDIARMFFDQVVGAAGPGVDGRHYSELELDELKTLFVYLRMAFYEALEAHASTEVMEVLVEWYDEVFMALLEGSDKFRSAVCSRTHRPIINETKYYELAGCRSAN